MSKSPTTVKAEVAAILNEAVEPVSIKATAPSDNGRHFMERVDYECQKLGLRYDIPEWKPDYSKVPGVRGKVIRGLGKMADGMAPMDVSLSAGKTFNGVAHVVLVFHTKRAQAKANELIAALDATVVS